MRPRSIRIAPASPHRWTPCVTYNQIYSMYMNKTLTDEQLDAVWRRAGKAQDMTMVDFCERALDGDEFIRRLVGQSVRDVSIYAEAVATVATP